MLQKRPKRQEALALIQVMKREGFSVDDFRTIVFSKPDY